MHIPDGFLATPVWASLDILALPCVGFLARRAQRETEETKLPLLGVMGAFVFAAQMINFPVGPGTSGHLVGGALLAATLGPAPAAIVMTAILALQALVFQDGGILSLGANVFNMAIAGVLAGYFPYRMLAGSSGASRGSRNLALFLGGFLSVLVSACLALIQLLLSGVAMPGGVLGLSLGLFVVSAALEGAITVAVVNAIDRLNPTWIKAPVRQPRRAFAWIGMTAMLLVVGGVLVASAAPDGIQSLANQTGIASQTQALLAAPLAEYQVRGLNSEWLRKAAAGLCGLILVYVSCIGLERLLRRRTAPGA
ncbi:MAG: energy-coupling factor ABC transporter permease [Bryobacteraceae bacterium]